MQIEKQAQDIMGHLARLEGDFERFRAAYGVLGGHLEKARKKYEETERALDRFEAKLSGAWDPSLGLPNSRDEVEDPPGEGVGES
jgi:DNA anti-recombination protein RmuC